MSPGDPFALYALVVIFGFQLGWFSLMYWLFVAWRFCGLQLNWTNGLGILLLLAAGLATVVFTITSQAAHLTGTFVYLPATFVGSALAGGLAYHGSWLYQSVRERKDR